MHFYSCDDVITFIKPLGMATGFVYSVNENISIHSPCYIYSITLLRKYGLELTKINKLPTIPQCQGDGSDQWSLKKHYWNLSSICRVI